MCCEQTPWLVEHVAVPAIFVLLGALLGFFAGQIKDYSYFPVKSVFACRAAEHYTHLSGRIVLFFLLVGYPAGEDPVSGDA
jgi:hypothetical protein